VRQVGIGAPAALATLEHMAVVQEAIEHGADAGRVAQKFAPTQSLTAFSKPAPTTNSDDFQYFFDPKSSIQ
jgi:hypothetical protein